MKVPDQLRRLAGPKEKTAMQASHELWCGLCHQHAQVGSAALPALPFLLEVLDSAKRQLSVEILDILLGLAIGTNRQRAIDFQRQLGREDIQPEECWVRDLRLTLLAELPRFQQLAVTQEEEIADFAERIVAELEAALPQPGKL